MNMETTLDTIRDKATTLQAKADYCAELGGAVKDLLGEIGKAAENGASPIAKLLIDRTLTSANVLLSLLQDIAGDSHVAAEAIEAAELDIRRAVIGATREVVREAA